MHYIKDAKKIVSTKALPAYEQRLKGSTTSKQFNNAKNEKDTCNEKWF